MWYLNLGFIKRKESWHGLLADIKETFVLDLDDVDWEEVGAKDLEVTGRNEARAKHLVDLLDKLNKLWLKNFCKHKQFYLRKLYAIFSLWVLQRRSRSKSLSESHVIHLFWYPLYLGQVNNLCLLSTGLALIGKGLFLLLNAFSDLRRRLWSIANLADFTLIIIVNDL